MSETGRIDIHCHLLPGVDDGCPTMEEAVACARLMVRGGYAHTFCTPHVWPNLPDSTPANIARWTAQFQERLVAEKIPLEVLPGAELGLSYASELADADVTTYALARRHVLVDFWADEVPDYFVPAVRRLQSLGLQVILAHPERVACVQAAPAIVGSFLEMGVLLQGNLKCLSDPLESPNRRTVERLLLENRYFAFGTDCHRLDGLPERLDGVFRLVELVGRQAAARLTIENPRALLPAP